MATTYHPQTVAELQAAVGATPDGKWGPKSKAALLAHFTNLNAPAITADEEGAIAARLGVTILQLQAVARAESRGAGFDGQGRPKILYERHIFHRLTDGKYSPSAFSLAKWGGYSESSWDKLNAAVSKDPDAGFSSCSWGAFQVMGMHWSKLGYASPYALAHSTATSEKAQYDLLVGFIEMNKLQDEMRAISPNPEDCRPFARGYNGPDYARNKYHEVIAAGMI